MTSPLSQNPLTPWTQVTWGRLRELVLNQRGVSDAGHASPNTNLPAANSWEIAIAGEHLQEALLELESSHSRYWPLSESTVTADGDFTSILLPADFESIPKGGCHINGNPVDVLTTEQWLRTRVPDTLGGGTSLTRAAGTPAQTRTVAVIKPARQTNDTTAWRMALWLYPVQTAAWTMEFVYRATVKNMTGDLWPIRLPNRFRRPILLYCSMRGCEQNKDFEGAAAFMGLYEKALSTIADTSPSEEQQSEMILGYPIDG